MKERYWTNLIASLRHGQCILVLGSDVPIRSKSTTPESDSVRESTFAEELRLRLVKELEDDSRLPSGTTLSLKNAVLPPHIPDNNTGIVAVPSGNCVDSELRLQ